MVERRSVPDSGSNGRVTEIRSGLFQIKLPLPIRSLLVQVYLFHRGARSVLVDTGFGTDEAP